MKTLAAWLRRPFGAALAAFLALRLLTSGLAALTAALTPVWITVEAPHDPTLLAQLEEGSPALRLLAAPMALALTLLGLPVPTSHSSPLRGLARAHALPTR